jgi:hypothetical protein
MKKGTVAALWAAMIWGLLAFDAYAPVAVVSILSAATIKLRILSRHKALLLGTAAFGLAISVAGLLLRVPATEVADGVLRLLALVAVVPLASEYVDVFWICRVLSRLGAPHRITLAIASSFAALPVLIEDMTSLIYHRRMLHPQSGVSALVATFVMTLDRVEELEVVEYSFDMTSLFTRAEPPPITRGELLYLMHIAGVVAWIWIS